ncbi:MAG: preprotein translocase subunit SecE [Pontiellaceae bacterium]
MFKWTGKIKQFVGEVKTELIKCSWPTKKELYGQSIVVIVAVILLGVFIAVCDRVNFSLLDLIIR